MFKLVVLCALLAVAAARPGYLSAHGPLLYSAPATVIHEPAYAKVGAIVKSIPTAVSHQSISQVHSSAHVVQPIVAPVVKTTIAAAPILHAAPVVHAPAISYAAHGLHLPSW
ncbi:hypothetical protein FF38_09549 [Lucilia cuprina]|uniref:Uncharacterized protein n=2 Tax=Lucilia TaxID=7374 RepID=A0A0L0CCB8_LUCCU|nr:neuropeptide-like 3 [Lucilia cuprina]KAI8120225.1 Retinin [Lucilia cuprina]KNC30083.1 hypothetical protein FF38_09549 [Lucilia cuprina]